MTHPTPEFLAFQTALAGEYSLQREIGRGGMGVVYLARDVQLDRDVAIKVLPTHIASAPEARERFLREARLAAGLSHPNIVPIYRVGESGGFVYFVMAYVDGETLGQLLRTRGPLPPADATRILREVAWALAYAHGRGVVHRDIKPDNILLEAGSGRALVTDFGIAHETGTATPSDPGKIAGTAHFMSPEQAAGTAVDGRSDIYSLGVVGHLAVSGRLPFEAETLPALLVQQASGEPRSVMLSAPGLPGPLGSAIDKCLARDPAARFADAESVAEALAPVTTTRPPLPPTLRAWLASRNPLLVPYLAWTGGFGTLTLANLIAWVTGNRPDGPADIVLLAGITAAPLIPIVGYHINQALRQFRAGHTLADLRSALAIEQQEREETEASVRRESEPASHRVLRLATLVAGSWLATTVGLLIAGIVHERDYGMLLIVGPVGSTLALAAASNALDVQFVPNRLRRWWQEGLRARLWKGRLGEWISRRLGAPARTMVAGSGAFRATEAALSVAASELYAALPSSYREQLADLPALVANLEARAAEARAEIDVVGALVPSGDADEALLHERRVRASEHLSRSVAALEGIRLDLLRLHAGASDLAPLTTLMHDAREVSDDLARLASAEREVERSLQRRLPRGADEG